MQEPFDLLIFASVHTTWSSVGDGGVQSWLDVLPLQPTSSRPSLRLFIPRPVQLLLRQRETCSQGTPVPDIQSYAPRVRSDTLMDVSHADIDWSEDAVTPKRKLFNGDELNLRSTKLFRRYCQYLTNVKHHKFRGRLCSLILI